MKKVFNVRSAYFSVKRELRQKVVVPTVPYLAKVWCTKKEKRRKYSFMNIGNGKGGLTKG